MFTKIRIYLFPSTPQNLLDINTYYDSIMHISFAPDIAHFYGFKVSISLYKTMR